MVMKNLQAKNDTSTQKKLNDSNMIRLKRVKPVELLRSSTINPTAPKLNKKLEANPSIIYCPLTRY